MKPIKLKCDNCNWTIKGHTSNWHNKQCPDCNNCIIVTDEDLEIWKGIKALIDIGIVSQDLKGKKGISVKIDTASLRKKL